MTDFGGADDIRFERVGHVGLVTLTRASSLNAINHRMINALARALVAWETDPAVHLVVLTAEGRAFSAGGDILDVYRARGTGEPPVAFFADEYRLNAAIARFPKPYVSLIDGIVMGGGVGISHHGSHRVMTENAVFAMPEVAIGFFPDVGGSHLLPRLRGEFGMYLALTGNRIRAGDATAAGLATHAVEAANLSNVLDALCQTGEPDAVLSRHRAEFPGQTGEAALRSIVQHFSAPALNDVLGSLERSDDEFDRATLETILKRSPTSLHVTFRQIREGARLSMDDCMRMEYRILNRMLAGHDFYEGIRTVLIDKGSAPKWHPARLSDVVPEDIEAYFAPLLEGELAL